MINGSKNLGGNMMRLGQLLSLGFGAVFVLMVSIGLATKASMNTLEATVDMVKFTYEVKDKIKALENHLVNAETGERGFIITGQENFLEPYKKATQIIQGEFANLKTMLVHDPEQLNRIKEVEILAKSRIDKLAFNISLKRAIKNEQVMQQVLSDKGNLIMDEIRVKLAEMEAIQDNLLSQRQEAAKRAERFANLVTLGGTATALAFGTLIVIFIVRKIVQPINQVANTIASSSAEIATTIEQQERTATQQAIAVGQTSTTMDELGASSRQSAEQAEAAASISQQVLSLVDGRTQIERHTLVSESSLRDKVGQIASQILRLSEQVSQIYNIANAVGDLANQTNMLAINAAVEAARAGEHGKGFAVVASEIRKLADQSRKSAEKINSLVIDIQNATNSTVLVTDEGSKTVENIVMAINDIAVNSRQISLTAKQQAIAIEQVVDAMNSLNQSAQETADGISQIRVGTQQLNKAALNLKAVV